MRTRWSERRGSVALGRCGGSPAYVDDLNDDCERLSRGAANRKFLVANRKTPPHPGGSVMVEGRESQRPRHNPVAFHIHGRLKPQLHPRLSAVIVRSVPAVADAGVDRRWRRKPVVTLKPCVVSGVFSLYPFLEKMRPLGPHQCKHYRKRNPLSGLTPDAASERQKTCEGAQSCTATWSVDRKSSMSRLHEDQN